MKGSSFSAAADVSRRAARQAGSDGDRYAAAMFLYYLSRALGSAGSWGEAVAQATESRRLALEINAPKLVSAASFTLAGAYFVSNELDMALNAVATMFEYADPAQPNISLYTLASAIAANSGQLDRALEYSQQAVARSFEAGTIEDLGFAYNELGARRLWSGDLERAERTLSEAFRLRLMAKSNYLAVTYHNLGVLRFEQGRAPEAVALLSRAIQSPSPQANILPWSYYRLARARLKSGQSSEALADARTSLGLIRSMRLNHPFGNDLQVRSEARLQDLYDFFLEAALEWSKRTQDRSLVEEAFSAAEENRASSLVVRAATGDFWRRKLPPDYFAKLGRLRALEADAIRTRKAPGDTLLNLRADLAAAESASGLEAANQYTVQPAERRARLDRALGDREVLVSFHLGTPKSHAFVRTRSGVEVRELGSRESIETQAAAFREALESGAPDSRLLGAALYRSLFGPLEPLIRAPVLTIVPDEQLYALPFAALTVETAGGPKFLAELSAIRLAPSAFFFGGRRQHSRPLRFTGIADPIFNKADPRWTGNRPGLIGQRFGFAPPDRELPRLIAGEAEVRAAAVLWPDARLVTGAAVSLDSVSRALAESSGILHVASHMLRRSQDAPPSIALGLDPAGSLTVWTPDDIAVIENAPEFVTLSGCGSGRGPALRGAGLLGLTRSWLMAGSRAIAASYWPTPEESAQLFAAYYRQLRDLEPEASASRRAALALQRSQTAAIRAGGWQADPRFWAAYFVIGAL